MASEWNVLSGPMVFKKAGKNGAPAPFYAAMKAQPPQLRNADGRPLTLNIGKNKQLRE
jgi:hypothetical protein